jgi:hypothetical protein
MATNCQDLGHICRMNPFFSEIALVISCQWQAKSRARSESAYPCCYRVSAPQAVDFMVLAATLSRETLVIKERRWYK